MFIDTHCHLTFPELSARWDDIRAAMSAAQVERAIVICTTIEEFDTVHALAAQHDFLWCTVGVHPDNEDVHEPDVAELVRLGRRDRVVAVGECGLDYYRLGDDIYLLLTLPEDPQRYPVAGKVAWITPPNASGGRTQGVGVRFPVDEKTRVLRVRIEEMLGTSIQSAKPTQTI